LPWKDKNNVVRSIIIILLLALIIALALYLRLKFVFAVEHPPLREHSDPYNYDIMVKQFLAHGFLGYLSSQPNAYVTPGYPLFLALLYRLLGYSQGSPLQAVMVVQAVAGALTAGLMYFIGKEIKNPRVGLTAAFLAAVYPSFVWAPTLLLTEVLYTFFFMLYFYIQLLHLKKPAPVLGVLTGLLFGAAVLIRPAAAPLLVVPYLYHFYRTKALLPSLQIFGHALAGFVIVMLPWWIRNVVTLHQMIFLATQTWNPLLAGAYPHFTGIEKMPDNVRSTREIFSFILHGFLTQPLLYLKWYTIGKFQIIFSNMWYDLDLRYSYLRSIYFLHHFIYVPGWMGAFFAFRREEIRLPALFVFLLTAIQLMFIPTTRYAFTIMPLLILLASYLVNHLFWPDQLVVKTGRKALT
jgi:4-amino-4-deoxy-L-arabinose transferase-like glycosyltransferase